MDANEIVMPKHIWRITEYCAI